jgi:flagellar biosynthesis protein FlhF
MKIKKYTAKSMKEALLQIKEDLGEDAVILKTSKVQRKMFSLGGGDDIEVTAAIDDQAPKRRISPDMPPLQAPGPGLYKRPKPGGNSAAPRRAETAGSLDAENDGCPSHAFSEAGASASSSKKINIVSIKEDIRELKELLDPIACHNEKPDGYTEPFAGLYARLIDSEVKPDIARRLLGRIKGGSGISARETDKRFMEALQASFPVAGPLRLKESGPLICAFVGPTGVGKTTTLAKLAAHFRLNKNKLVSIITADTYRIAAIEQIRTFADIMSIRLHAVFSPEETSEALGACASDDIVFIDTAGRSGKNAEHMQDLRRFMESMHPHETHLVLSATTKDADLMDNIDRYRPMGVNRVLFTKFDETNRLGNVFNSVAASSIPASYFTFGQGVPDDIELAQPVRFMNRLWKDGSI